MSTADPSNDDEILAELDFSTGTRSKFLCLGATLALPVYMDRDMQARLTVLANPRVSISPPSSTTCCARISS